MMKYILKIDNKNSKILKLQNIKNIIIILILFINNLT